MNILSSRTGLIAAKIEDPGRKWLMAFVVDVT